jgi:SAM-dependent methyltransferase
VGSIDIEDALGVHELRARALEHTRRAFAMLPALERPRILDIGCGRGAVTLELARLGRGEVVGIDIDATALSRLRERITEVGLADRVTVRRASLLEPGLSAESFDILWAEGVLHLLDPAASFPACHRLARPDGFLVMHEQLVWFDGVRERLCEWGMSHVGQHLLPRHFWWTEYGAVLEQRVAAYRAAHGSAPDPPELTRYADEAAMIRQDPDRFECGFFLLQRRRRP